MPWVWRVVHHHCKENMMCATFGYFGKLYVGLMWKQLFFPPSSCQHPESLVVPQPQTAESPQIWLGSVEFGVECFISVTSHAYFPLFSNITDRPVYFSTSLCAVVPDLLTPFRNEPILIIEFSR